MKDHDTFKIVDGETGNTVGFYEDGEEAISAFRRMVAEFPEDRRALVLTAMDRVGRPVESWLAEDVDAATPTRTPPAPTPR